MVQNTNNILGDVNACFFEYKQRFQRYYERLTTATTTASLTIRNNFPSFFLIHKRFRDFNISVSIFLASSRFISIILTT